jgi:hypothetical protein
VLTLLLLIGLVIAAFYVFGAGNMILILAVLGFFLTHGCERERRPIIPRDRCAVMCRCSESGERCAPRCVCGAKRLDFPSTQ